MIEVFDMTAARITLARILPALADQLRLETSHCGHPRTPAPITGYPRRAS